MPAMWRTRTSLLKKSENIKKKAQPPIPQYAELKRRFGWEFDGMRLHELYFGNLAKEKTSLRERFRTQKTNRKRFRII